MENSASNLYLIGTLDISDYPHSVRVYYFTAIPASIPPPNNYFITSYLYM